MPQAVVVFDIDGVLANLCRGFTELGAEKFGTEIVSDEAAQPTWDFDNVMTREQQLMVWGHIAAHPRFWGTLEASPECDQDLMVARLTQPSLWKPMYLTNRQGKGVDQVTQDWLWRMGFPYGEVVCTDDKANFLLRRNHWSQRQIVGIIDDSPKNLEAFWAAGLPAYAMSRPYNLDLDGPRVNTVAEFLHVIARNLPYEEEEVEDA